MDKPTIKNQADLLSERFQSIDNLYDDYAKSVGLTYMSLLILEIIFATPENCTQKLICQQTRLPKQSVNTVIKSFLDQGYIDLKEDPSDRRNKKIRLSEAGRTYAEQIIETMWNAEQLAMEKMTVEQRNMLVELIGLYEKNFKHYI